MENYNKFLEEFKTLISFNSVEGESKKDAPFGDGVKNALNYVLGLAKSYGFETVNYDNYIGEISFGKGEEIGIIGHLDVVPVDNHWDTDPFTLVEKDGRFYGRGVCDDKGPVLTTLHVLIDIKNSGLKFKRRIRFFVGCNEETNWEDVEYLNKKTTIPYYGFSPDGDFPLSYAEKGILQTYIYIPKLKNFYDIKGGTVINAVCGEVTCRAKKEGIDKELIKKHGLLLDGDKITSVGISAHGSQPQLGKNAIKPLFEYFLDMGEDVKNVLDCLFYDKFGLTKLNNEQGFITFSPDVISEKNGKIEIACDCRFPAPFDFDVPKNIIKQFGIEFKTKEKHPSFMVEKEGFLVKALLSAYKEVMGTNAEPISMGGSTFARAFTRGCSFGIEFPLESCHPHEANESIAVSSILKAYDIYKKAIENLVK